jgi:hypothetical protein
MSHLSRTISASSHDCGLPEPAPLAEGLGEEPRPQSPAWETRSFMGAMLLIFAVAIILAIAISSR